MSVSGWCQPDTNHPYQHGLCQKELDAGRLPRGCECSEHGGHVTKEES